MFLYHGSNMAVEKPVLLQSSRMLDFGNGFYLTSDRNQAEKWAMTKTKRTGIGMATVSVFSISETDLYCLNILEFSRPNRDWLIFVSSCRKGKVPDENVDIVMGPVANDNTMPVLNLYLKGDYTEEEAVRRLLPQNLKDQYTFRTERALRCLKFVKAEQV